MNEMFSRIQWLLKKNYLKKCLAKKRERARERERVRENNKTFFRSHSSSFFFLPPRDTIMTETRSSRIIHARAHRIFIFLLYFLLPLPLLPNNTTISSSSSCVSLALLLISRRYNRSSRTSNRYERI